LNLLDCISFDSSVLKLCSTSFGFYSELRVIIDDHCNTLEIYRHNTVCKFLSRFL